jgi:hypothetical protein
MIIRKDYTFKTRCLFCFYTFVGIIHDLIYILSFCYIVTSMGIWAAIKMLNDENKY